MPSPFKIPVCSKIPTTKRIKSAANKKETTGSEINSKKQTILSKNVRPNSSKSGGCNISAGKNVLVVESNNPHPTSRPGNSGKNIMLSRNAGTGKAKSIADRRGISEIKR